MGLLEGDTALITGAASGIGRGIVIARFVASLSANPEPASQSGASGWACAFKKQSFKIFAETLAPSVMFEASVVNCVVQGRERVQTILTAASALYEALDFTRHIVDGDRTYMEWETRLGGHEHVAGVTVLIADAAGKISVIAIHHRPLLSALRFSAELGAELTVLPGFLEEVKAIFKEALIPTLQEPGCEALYETGRKDDPHKLVFFEVLSSAALQEFHLERDYKKRLLALDGKVSGIPTLTKLSAL